MARIITYTQGRSGHSSEWTKHHYEDELTRTGHELLTFTPEAPDGSTTSGDVDQYVIDRVAAVHKKNPVDLFFSSMFDDDMSPQAVKAIAAMGIPTAGVHYDAQLVSHRSKRIAPAFDLFWVIDPPAVSKMRALGANVYDAPVAANPYVYMPQDVDEDVEVSFCGQRYGSRIYYIEQLFKAGIDIELFGVGWKPERVASPDGPQQQPGLNLGAAFRHTMASVTHSHGRTWLRAAVLNRLQRAKRDPEIQRRIDRHSNAPLSFPDMIRLFSRSKVALDFNELGNTHLLSKPLVASRLRDFEALSSGACHLMYRVPAIEPHFEADKEILYYSSAEELADKIRFYTDPRQDGVRANIRAAARARTLRDHTWTQRFNDIFRLLGINQSELYKSYSV